MADPPLSPTSAPPPVVASQQSPFPMKSSSKQSSYTGSEKKEILKIVEKSMEEFGYIA